ncbi:MAG: hypothetical protein KDB26_13260 [Microthrixaceae bacterium]|nr:hypothetical protein [Microthrixaceae bacterium]
MQAASLILQLVGVLIAGSGMLVAWYAARDGLTVCEWVQQRRRQWHNRGKPVVIRVSTATATASMFPPTISVTYEHDPSLPLEDQVEQLAVTVESLRNGGKAQREAIRELRHELIDTSSRLAAQMDKFDTESQERLRQLLADQNKNRVIDLRWAVLGLGFTASGLLIDLICTG